MLNSRRSFLKQLGGITGAALVANSFFDPRMVKKVEAAAAKIAHLLPVEAATEEDFWFQVQQAYTTTDGIINLNNGGVSPQPKIVHDALVRYNEFSNEAPAQTMWNVLGPRRETIRSKLAELAGCSPKEIAIVRNTTEALETIIFGLDMKRGDEILTTNQDYPSMMRAWHQREKREGVVVKTVSIPTPPENVSEITEALKKSITNKTKVIMVSHIIFLTGQITPVREICDFLFNNHKIYTVPISHEEFKGVRVTPHVYTTLEELNYFVEVVEKIVKEGIPG